jgi:hypothetical protein
VRTSALVHICTDSGMIFETDFGTDFEMCPVIYCRRSGTQNEAGVPFGLKSV